MSIPEPRQWNGDDDRDFGGSGDGSPDRLFWRAFDFELRRSVEAAAAWVNTQRGYRCFADLVTEADRRLADLRRGAA